jgi:hypothetical protein
MSRDPLDQLLDELPRTIEPSRDLWPDIEAALPPRTDEPARLRPWRLAVAALLLVAATAAITAALVGRDARVAPSPTPPTVVQLAPAPDWQAEMRQASDLLASTLEQRRPDLDPATLAVVEENLAIIDRAIADCAAALETDPANDESLRRALLAVWRKKIDLLEQATRLPQA